VGGEAFPLVTRRRFTLALLLLALPALVYGSFWLVPLPQRLSEPDSAVVLWSDGQLAHTFLSGDERWRLSADVGQLDPAYLSALHSIEDERFAWHPGVDPLAIGRALISNLTHRRVVSGASTLTMQLARLLQPRPRNLRSKIIEAWRALQLTARIGRAEVQANYLRFLPFGGNLEGVHAASHAYFGHSAAHLDAAEIAVLLAVPQRPGRRAPSARNQQALLRARNAILLRLKDKGLIDQPALVVAKKMPLPRRRTGLPRELPYAARWMRQQRPKLQTIHSTLDQTLQRSARQLLRAGAVERNQMEVRHGAIVILDHAQRELRALVGGSDFFGPEKGSQIIAFDRPRHAASTLKPLLLGLAIDLGIAAIDQLVLDLPITRGGYRPKNFDGRFRGLVRLSEALAHSLNVPFVLLLQRLDVELFIGRLRNAGLRHTNPQPEHYGLAAALGTVPLTLLELSALYAAIAQDGAYLPLTWMVEQETTSALPLISPEAAWLLRRALRSRDRPDFPDRALIQGYDPSIHWKTGTSFGFHDAWSVGSDERHTIAVWLGNLDREPSRYLVGSPMAGPLLFDLFDASGHRQNEALGDAPPGGLDTISVCSFSGHLPGPGCLQTEEVLAPRRSVAVKPCPYHHLLHVDEEQRLAYAANCAPPGLAIKPVLLLPARVRYFSPDLLEEGYAEAPDCTAKPSRKLRITAPSSPVMMLIPGMSKGDQEVALEASAHEGAELSWFINGRFIGSAVAGKTLWWEPVKGENQLLVMDGTGRKTSMTLKVR
jgi:penicillin-binding protein 1C